MKKTERLLHVSPLHPVIGARTKSHDAAPTHSEVHSVLHPKLMPLVGGRFKLGDRPPAPRRTFRTHWELRCELQWYRSFYMFSLGMLPSL